MFVGRVLRGRRVVVRGRGVRGRRGVRGLSRPVVVRRRRLASWVVGLRVVGGGFSRRRCRVQGRELGELGHGSVGELRLGSRDLEARGRRRLAWSWLLALGLLG